MHCPFTVSQGFWHLTVIWVLSRHGLLSRMWMTTPQCLKVYATRTLCRKWLVSARPSCRWQHGTQTMRPTVWFTTVWRQPPPTALTLDPSSSILKLAPYSCTGLLGLGHNNDAFWKCTGWQSAFGSAIRSKWHRSLTASYYQDLKVYLLRREALILMKIRPYAGRSPYYGGLYSLQELNFLLMWHPFLKIQSVPFIHSWRSKVCPLSSMLLCSNHSSWAKHIPIVQTLSDTQYQ